VTRNARRNFAGRFHAFDGASNVNRNKLTISEIIETETSSPEATVYELIFTVCSVVAGASCREANPIPLQDNVGVMGCLIASQIEGAKWTEAHPNFYVSRYTCQPAKTFARI
jgi:hypothetical protein